MDTFPRPRHARRGTYSIVARDALSGAVGVAVQSHWFSVGPLVPWVEPGIGAVATQANVDVSYGPRLLELLRTGESAGAALAELVAADGEATVRQVAVVDAHGGIAAHTALDAGEAAGGDVRGRQSAAILVAPASGSPWERIVDLRVEDNPEPLMELRRLMRLHDAYVLAGEGDRFVGEGRMREAAIRYVQADEANPGNPELMFWAGLSLIAQGDEEGGLKLLRGAVATHGGWSDLLARLSPSSGPGVERARQLMGVAS
jgi:uncharacterized Ntn-hydrolase superfamily protein